MKKTLTYVIVFTIIGLTLGIFYREATKYTNFYDSIGAKTALAVAHTHTLILGAVIPLLFGLVLHTAQRTLDDVKIPWLVYIIGTALTIVMITTRGSLQVFDVSVSKGLDAAISGIAGIGHALVGVGLVWLLFKLASFFKNKEEVDI